MKRGITVNLLRKPEGRAERCISFTLLLMIVATLAFIYINSILPPDASAAESGRVAAFTRSLLPEGNALGDFIVNNLRKIAHFVEFGLLGSLVAAYASLFSNQRLKTAAISLALGHAAAFLDETLQIFSGRGPMIADVWIDFFGFLTFTLLVHTAFFIVRRISENS